MGTLAAIIVTAGCLTLGGHSPAQIDGPADFFGDQSVQVRSEPARSDSRNVTVAVTQAKDSKPNPALQKKITKRFTNVNLSEVLAWLSLQDLSFVADMGAFPDKKVTLNFRNQPLNKVMDTIAETFGGSWQKKGDIYTLTPKGGLFRSFSGATTFELATPRTLKTDIAPLIVKSLDGKTFVTSPKSFEPLFAIKEKDLQGKKLTPEQKKEIEKALAEAKAEIKKAIEELHKHKGEIKGMNDQQLQELIKQLNDIVGKTLPEVFKTIPQFQGGKSFTWTTPEGGVKFFGGAKSEAEAKAMLEKLKAHEMDLKMELPDVKVFVDKAMGEHMKALEKMKVLQGDEMKKHMQELEKLHGDKLKMLQSNEFKEQMKALEKMKVLQGDEMKKHMQELEKLHGDKFKMLQSDEFKEQMKALEKMKIEKLDGDKLKELFKGDAKVFRFGGQRLGELLKSLTDAQQAKMKDQGFLNPSDLTPAQKEMLGSLPDGNWTMSFTQNGQTVTIKSGK